MTTRTKKHLYAFGWAVLGGSVMAVGEALRSSLLVTPPVPIDWGHIQSVAIVGAITTVVAYLRQPPRRTWTHQERQAAWELAEAKKQLEQAKDKPCSSSDPDPKS